MKLASEDEVKTALDEWGEIQSRIQDDVAKAAAIEKAIKAYLKARPAKKLVIETSLAKAIKTQKLGDRVIAYGAFMSEAAAVDAVDRESCLKVAVAPAQKLLGKQVIDRISTQPITADIKIELK